MPNYENFIERKEEFIFEDNTSNYEKNLVIYSEIAHLYTNINWKEIEIDEMGGTTHFVYFGAKDKRKPKPFEELTSYEQQSRINTMFYLARNLID